MSTRAALFTLALLTVVSGALIVHVAHDGAAASAREEVAALVLRRAQAASAADQPRIALPSAVAPAPVQPLDAPPMSASADAGRAALRSDAEPRGPDLLIRASLANGEPAEPALAQALPGHIVLTAIATHEPPPTSVGTTVDRDDVNRFVRIGATGRRNLGESVLGTLTLDESGPAWISLLMNCTVLEQRLVSGDERELEFVVTNKMLAAVMGAARVRVVDHLTHVPIVGARVSLEQGDEHRPELAVSRQTDLGGLAVVDWHLPGEFELVVRADGYLTSRLPVVVPPGGRLDLPDVALDKPMVIEGIVLDQHGRPLHAIVSCYPIDDELRNAGLLSAAAATRGRTAVCDADGRFRFHTLAPDEYLIRVTPREWDATTLSAAPLRVDTRRGHVRDLRVTAWPGTEVTLVPTWTDDSRLDVHLRDAGGLPVNAPRNLVGGRVLHLWLLPGNYELALSSGDPDAHPHSRRSFVVGHQPLTLDVDA